MVARSGTGDRTRPAGFLHRANGSRGPAPPRWPSAALFAADQLAQAVKLDMADWWTPTGESYLGRVKKDQILAAIGEGTKETNFEDLRKLKKGELVAAAERRLAGSRWLPEILKS